MANMSTRRALYAGCSLILAILSPMEASANGADFALGLVGGMMGMAFSQQAYRPYGYHRSVPRHVHFAPKAVKSVGRIPITTTSATAGTAANVRFFFDCQKSTIDYSASAEVGHVELRDSSRFVCGSVGTHVKEVIYRGPTGFSGVDRISYFRSGRLVRLENVVVNEGITDHAAASDNAEPMVVPPHVASQVYQFARCSDMDPPLSVDARAYDGDITVMDGTGPACGRAAVPLKKVFYSPHGAEGLDTVTIRSSVMSPVQMAVKVKAADIQPSVLPACEAPNPLLVQAMDADVQRDEGGLLGMLRNAKLVENASAAADRHVTSIALTGPNANVFTRNLWLVQLMAVKGGANFCEASYRGRDDEAGGYYEMRFRMNGPQPTLIIPHEGEDLKTVSAELRVGGQSIMTVPVTTQIPFADQRALLIEVPPKEFFGKVLPKMEAPSATTLSVHLGMRTFKAPVFGFNAVSTELNACSERVAAMQASQ